MILALARHIAAADRLVREGPVEHRDALTGFELRRKILGVIGVGAIGSRVAQICHSGFEMQAFAFDPYVEASRLGPSVTRVLALQALLTQADVVTVHVPLSTETTHMINADTLRHMKRSALLINTSRGTVVDGIALAKALAEGCLLGAALRLMEETMCPSGG